MPHSCHGLVLKIHAPRNGTLNQLFHHCVRCVPRAGGNFQDLQPSQAGVDAQRFSLAARSHCDVHDGAWKLQQRPTRDASWDRNPLGENAPHVGWCWGRSVMLSNEEGDPGAVDHAEVAFNGI